MRRDAERKVADGTRRSVEIHARIAARGQHQQPVFFGITDAEIERGSGGTVSVWTYSLTDSEWQDSDKNVTNVQLFFQNTSEALPAGTAVKVIWYETTWLIENWYCDVADWTGA